MKKSLIKKCLFFTLTLSFWEFTFLKPMAPEGMRAEEVSPETIVSEMPTEEAPTSISEIDTYKQEWSQIKTEIENIDQMESKILEQLRKLDDKLDKAIDESVNARKLSVEMLKITDEKVATENLNKLKESLGKVKKVQDEISQFTNNLDATFNQIQTQMQQVQTKVKQLEEKAISLGITKKIKLEEIEEREKEEEGIKKKKVPKSYLFKKSVNIFAGTINFINNAKNWIVDVFKQGLAKSKEKEEEVSWEEKVGAVPQNQVPATIKTQMEKLEKNIKKLEKEKVKVTEKRKELEETKQKRLEQSHHKIELIEKLEVEEFEEAAIPKKSTWKQEAEYLFSKFLDLISWGANKIKYYSKYFYENIIKKEVTKFISAVQKRVSQLEKVEKFLPEEKLPPIEMPTEALEEPSPEQEAAEMGPPPTESMEGPPPTTSEEENI